MEGATPGRSYTREEFRLGEVTHWEELCNGRSYTWEDPETSQFPSTSRQGQAIGGVPPGKSYALGGVTHWEELHTGDVTHWEDLHIERGYSLGGVTNLNLGRATHRRSYILEVLRTGKSYVLERFI